MTEVWDVTTARELADAFDRAEGGDQINLSQGRFGPVVLEGRSFANPVRLSGARGGGSVIESLQVEDVSGLILENLSVHPQDFDALLLDLVSINGGRDIRLRAIDVAGAIPNLDDEALPEHGVTDKSDVGRPIAGFAHQRGIRIRNSTAVVVERSEITDVRTGIVLHEVQSISVEQNHLHRIRSDGVAIADATDVRVTGNLMYQFTPFRNVVAPRLSDHPDFIQWWTSPGGAIDGLEITGNLLLQGQTGWIQGIFGRGRASETDLDARAIRIEDNIINTSHPNAIVVGNAHDVDIVRNLLIPAPLDPALPMATSGRPGIFVRADRRGEISASPHDLNVSENLIVAGRLPAFFGFPPIEKAALERASRNNRVIESLAAPGACASTPIDLSGCLSKLPDENPLLQFIEIPMWMRSMEFEQAAREGRVFGTEVSDVLTGTEGSDVFLGNGGNDVIRLQGGADQIVLSRSEMRPGGFIRIEGSDDATDLHVIFSGGFPSNFFDGDAAKATDDFAVFYAGRSAIVSVPDGFLALAHQDRFSILKDGKKGWAALIDLDENGDPDWAILFPATAGVSGPSDLTAEVGIAPSNEPWICTLTDGGC